MYKALKDHFEDRNIGNKKSRIVFMKKGSIYSGDILKGDRKATQEEIEQYFIKNYREKRIDEYPPLNEQLDMIYHDFNGWKKLIKTIKEKYPKV